MLNKILILLMLSGMINAEIQVSPQQLLHPLRLDIMAKYIYAKHCELQVQDDFALNLYAAHLKALNGFYEERPFKNGLADYLKAFEQILTSVKAQGYQSDLGINYPINAKKGSPWNLYGCDGAHRIGACLLYNCPVSLKAILDDAVLPPYNYRFLRRKQLDQKYLDAMALEYCKLSSKTYLAFIFPCYNQDLEQVYELLGGDQKIIYTKTICLPEMQGQMNLLEQLYSGWNSYTPGAMHEWQKYFPPSAPKEVTLVFFENASLEHVKEIKAKIRMLANTHFAVHMTDEKAETLELAQLLLVENGIHLLNYRKNGCLPNLSDFLMQYKKWLLEKEVDQDSFCIDGSAIMAAYGLRDCNDLDVLHHGYDDLALELKSMGIDSNNHDMRYHDYTKDQIIFDPGHFFYFKGIKFGSLAVIKARKKNRASGASDLRDVNLISAILP